MHWDLCGKLGLERVTKWYVPEGVTRKGTSKILWNFSIRCDNEIEYRRPDIEVVNEDLRFWSKIKEK